MHGRIQPLGWVETQERNPVCDKQVQFVNANHIPIPLCSLLSVYVLCLRLCFCVYATIPMHTAVCILFSIKSVSVLLACTDPDTQTCAHIAVNPPVKVVCGWPGYLSTELQEMETSTVDEFKDFNLEQTSTQHACTVYTLPCTHTNTPTHICTHMLGHWHYDKLEQWGGTNRRTCIWTPIYATII